MLYKYIKLLILKYIKGLIGLNIIKDKGIFMKYKRIKIIINNKIEKQIKAYFNGDVKELNHQINTSVKVMDDYIVNISITFKGSNYGKNIKELKIGCILTDDNYLQTSELLAFKYGESYSMFEMNFKYKDITYLIIMSPNITIGDSPDLIINNVKNIYCLDSKQTIQYIVSYTDFKKTKDKIYLCLLLYVISMRIPESVKELLYSRLCYYGYDGYIDSIVFNNELSKTKTVNELSDLFLKLACNILSNKITINSDIYKRYSDIIMSEYKRLLLEEI